MGAKYRHLSIEERCEVARLRTAGYSVRQIAASLDRSPSTISRELKRNGSRTQGYQPGYAHQQAHARRWRGSKLERNDSLGEQVLARLRQNWSPEQVAGRLAPEAGRTVVSHETIYRFIYARIARKKDYSWRHYLPGAKSKRGWRGRKGGNPASFIQLRRPLSERPADASGRDAPGHWEADLMPSADRGRPSSSCTSATPVCSSPCGSRARRQIASAMTQVLAAFPAPWRRTVAFDNGTEFARHHRLHALGVQTFSATPIPPGRREAWRTPSGACAAHCRARPIWRNCPTTGSTSWCAVATTPRANAWAATPRQKYCLIIPPTHFTNQVLHLKCESSYREFRE